MGYLALFIALLGCFWLFWLFLGCLVCVAQKSIFCRPKGPAKADFLAPLVGIADQGCRHPQNQAWRPGFEGSGALIAPKKALAIAAPALPPWALKGPFWRAGALQFYLFSLVVAASGSSAFAAAEG